MPTFGRASLTVGRTWVYEACFTPHLRRFAKVVDVPDVEYIYRFLSRLDEKQFIYLVSGVLNTICSKRSKRRTKILIDSTAIILDLNWIRKKISKRDLESKEFKWAFSSTHGYYIGFKLTFAIEYPIFRSP